MTWAALYMFVGSFVGFGLLYFFIKWVVDLMFHHARQVRIVRQERNRRVR